MDRHLFDAQNQGAVGDILVENGSGLLVLGIREDSFHGGLNFNFKMGVFGEDLLDLFRDEGSSPLPYTFVLSADSNPICLLHLQRNNC